MGYQLKREGLCSCILEPDGDEGDVELARPNSHELLVGSTTTCGGLTDHAVHAVEPETDAVVLQAAVAMVVNPWCEDVVIAVVG